MKYISPRVLAEAVGLSESSLKRWADDGRLAVERTAGGHRRIPIAEAVGFIRRSGLRPVRPELLGMPAQRRGAGRGEGERSTVAEHLTALLLADQAAEARSLIVSLYLGGSSLGWILDGPVRTALAHVGGLWEHGPGGVFLEHRATETCAAALGELRFLLPAPAADAPTAVGGAFERDVYHLPSGMVALVLAEAGFQDRNLGADTPVEALLEAIGHYRPRLVWQSFSVKPRSEREAVDGVARIVDAMRGATLILGGRESGSVPLPHHSGVHRLESMTELSAFARGMISLAGTE